MQVSPALPWGPGTEGVIRFANPVSPQELADGYLQINSSDGLLQPNLNAGNEEISYKSRRTIVKTVAIGQYTGNEIVELSVENIINSGVQITGVETATARGLLTGTVSCNTLEDSQPQYGDLVVLLGGFEKQGVWESCLFTQDGKTVLAGIYEDGEGPSNSVRLVEDGVTITHETRLGSVDPADYEWMSDYPLVRVEIDLGMLRVLYEPNDFQDSGIKALNKGEDPITYDSNQGLYIELS